MITPVKKHYTTLIFFFVIAGIVTVMAKMPAGRVQMREADTIPAIPDENRFTRVTLTTNMAEPMELAVAPNGDVFFIERAGNFYRYDHNTHKTVLVHKFPVMALDALNGLLGLTIDPDFSRNRFVYLYHTVQEKGQLVQYLSRFTLNAGKTLNTASEKVVLKVPVDKSGRTHTGGSLAWDRDKNLYISTGDNTSPFESDGYDPIDERPGRAGFDAQRSAGNTNDLRGKILRIHPEPNGTYTIPKGNLFPVGEAKTRPEIYVMGCRNPYRIGVDTATSILYWGEVGPDAFYGGKRGPHGYDEFNQAKQAGNYGWPYFVGENQPYAKYDFATKTIGRFFDAARPVNNSPNNTGLVNLPPAQKAIIWYPYGNSPEFPLMGSGGRSAMAGPVYHYDPVLRSKVKFPEYYDRALFIFDWMRKLVFAVRFNQHSDYKSMERFMLATGDFIRPIDMQFGTDGALYVLEYGTVYGANNPDSRLVRIEYNAGNRPPAARIAADKIAGHVPFKVSFSSAKSFDLDNGDKLTYQWRFGDNSPVSTDANPVHIYKRNGIYKVKLKVADQHGESSQSSITVRAGNTPPQVTIHIKGNRTFFFPGINSLGYRVAVTDKEDKFINKKRVKISLAYLPGAESNTVKGTLDPEAFSDGKALIAANDCKACHKEYTKVIGPAFMAVSKRYKNDNATVSKLADKVIKGGSGAWGKDAMSAHPQLAKNDAVKIIRYILALSRQQRRVNLPQQGIVTLNKHTGSPNSGQYVFTASYTDGGGAITPLTTTTRLALRPARFQLADADSINHIQKQDTLLTNISDGSFFILKDIDLTGINKLAYNYSSISESGAIQLRLDSLNGPVLSSVQFEPTGNWQKFMQLNASFTATGSHDLYFVFQNKQSPKKQLCRLKWVQFKR